MSTPTRSRQCSPCATSSRTTRRSCSCARAGATTAARIRISCSTGRSSGSPAFWSPGTISAPGPRARRRCGECWRTTSASSWRAASPTSIARTACRTACFRSRSPRRTPRRSSNGWWRRTDQRRSRSILRRNASAARAGAISPSSCRAPTACACSKASTISALPSSTRTRSRSGNGRSPRCSRGCRRPATAAVADIAFASQLDSRGTRRRRKRMNARQKLRAIMAGKRLVLMPGAYDALSARIIEAEGFEAQVAGGYAAIGSMLAQADMGQSNMRDYADHYARICAAVEIPVYVDADTGFGGVNNVRQMVRAFEAAGVAGLFISDQVFPNRCGYLPGKQIVPVEQMLAKIKAALDARRDGDLFIAARTDAAGVEGIDAAIARCQLFMQAGADMAKPMGVDTIPDIKRVLREVEGPHMATLSQAAGPKARSLEELEAAGVCAAPFPSLALFAAAQAVRDVLRTLKRGNSLAPCQDYLMPLDHYYELVGLKPMLAREESYDQAAALARQRAAE